MVRFAGYGNEETVWLDDIIDSHGDEVWQKQVKDGSAAEEVEEKQAVAAAVDEVEETLVGAVASLTAEKDASLAVPIAVVAVGKKEWAVGEYCRATFTEDGIEYEAKLTSIEVESDGNKYGIVLYLGFENQETQWLENLKPSEGATARTKQIRDAKGDEAEAAEVSNTDEKIPEAEKVVDKPAEVDEHKLTNADDPKANGIIEWKVGDR